MAEGADKNGVADDRIQGFGCLVASPMPEEFLPLVSTTLAYFGVLAQGLRLAGERVNAKDKNSARAVTQFVGEDMAMFSQLVAASLPRLIEHLQSALASVGTESTPIEIFTDIVDPEKFFGPDNMKIYKRLHADHKAGKFPFDDFCKHFIYFSLAGSPKKWDEEPVEK